MYPFVVIRVRKYRQLLVFTYLITPISENQCIFAAMKKILVMVAVAMMTAINALAQTSLAGRTYYNANILAGEFDKMMAEMDQKLDSLRIRAYAKDKEKKGRELTAEEKAEVEKKVQEAQAMMIAIKKGMKTAVTVDFKTENKAVMKMDMSISDDALKAAGVGWLKRKALKAALALAPSTEKATYEVKGNLVIMKDSDGELDTLHLSPDGKKLSGIMEEGGMGKKPTKFTLTRTN